MSKLTKSLTAKLAGAALAGTISTTALADSAVDTNFDTTSNVIKKIGDATQRLKDFQNTYTVNAPQGTSLKDERFVRCLKDELPTVFKNVVRSYGPYDYQIGDRLDFTIEAYVNPGDERTSGINTNDYIPTNQLVQQEVSLSFNAQRATISTHSVMGKNGALFAAGQAYGDEHGSYRDEAKGLKTSAMTVTTACAAKLAP